ncbi:hypothetical protein SAZ10_02575 [Mesorhizobium sp. BAC0120]|uniref:hypothetical protein n=1 Tax=Mesorhizobium sp. BAC0120 TaxID=3090670 RepID=UPI00298CCB30|nr:hypothetical protein [Mesorhizobium sp. BAC0120]MDW6020642.1 hypothetical protein [Mesorhizobium sp. BAC0120]
MKRTTSLLMAAVCLGFCSVARSDNFPQVDSRAECQGRPGGSYYVAVCLAREERAKRELRPKWSALPTEIRQHCFFNVQPSYDSMATCVVADVVELKAKKGQCNNGPCGPDPELDPLIPNIPIGDPDVAPFPRWDVIVGCGNSLIAIGMKSDVGLCISDETLAKARLALYWNSLQGVLRYDCLERTAEMKSYDLLGACIKTTLINAK